MNMIANAPSFQQEEMGLSRVEYAYRKIKNNITTNIYPSGFQMLEPELAEKLGVSRTPVREALIRLEADKLIQLIPRRGMRVNSLAASDVQEVMKLIDALLQCVVYQICSEVELLNFSQIDIALDEFSELLEHADIEPWVLLEEKFVMAVATETGNRRLKSLLLSMLEQVRRVKIIVYGHEHDRHSQLESIKRFTDALKSRQLDEAQSALSKYVDDFVELAGSVQQKQRLNGF